MNAVNWENYLIGKINSKKFDIDRATSIFSHLRSFEADPGGRIPPFLQPSCLLKVNRNDLQNIYTELVNSVFKKQFS